MSSKPSLNPFQFDRTVTALTALLPLTHPADVALSHFFRAHSKLGSADRHAIAEHVFGVLRHKLWLDWKVPGANPRQLLLAYLRLTRGLPQRELQPFLNERDTQWLAEALARDAGEVPTSAKAELPDWVLSRLDGVLPAEEILQLGRALQQPAPLDLRVNTLKDDREAVTKTLTAAGFEVTPTPYSPIGLRVAGKPAINKHPLFLKGSVEVQDEGSQLLGLLLAPRRQEMVVDFCAGAGGKTLLLGALMASTGRLYAFDVSEKRISNLKPRLARSGLSNVHPQLITSESDARVKRLAGKIDRVLVDAPCSGLGTLRRNPDLKFRQSEQSVGELVEKQAAILVSASRLVKAGGRLVYATCSLLPEENQQQVERFLAAHGDFKLLPAGELLAGLKIPLEMGDYLTLYPHRHGTDGFFAAVMERTA